jgi:tripartite-type tricarboxylate transporter receptor subunit TctC
MKVGKRNWKVAASLGLWAILLSLLPGSGFAQTPFYKGKTITFIQAREPGGSGDLRVRAILPALAKHIPGNPTIVMQFMPGFGGRKAANHLYKTARPDGLTIANMSASTIPLALLGEAGVEYDIDKLVHLAIVFGTPYSLAEGPRAWILWRSSGTPLEFVALVRFAPDLIALELCANDRKI